MIEIRRFLRDDLEHKYLACWTLARPPTSGTGAPRLARAAAFPLQPVNPIIVIAVMSGGPGFALTWFAACSTAEVSQLNGQDCQLPDTLIITLSSHN